MSCNAFRRKNVDRRLNIMQKTNGVNVFITEIFSLNEAGL